LPSEKAFCFDAESLLVFEAYRFFSNWGRKSALECGEGFVDCLQGRGHCIPKNLGNGAGVEKPDIFIKEIIAFQKAPSQQ